MNDQTKTDAGAGKGGATVTVQLVRSVAGTRESHRATVRGLGLRKTNSTSTLEDTPAVRGMIAKVSYLVKVL
jgi:large subunit ribosomal protein L30